MNDRDAASIAQLLLRLGLVTEDQLNEAWEEVGRRNTDPFALLRVLERKGHLVHRAEGKAYLYTADETREKARARLLRHLVDQVFGGSASSAVLSLVETGDLTRKDLDQIRDKIAAARKTRQDKTRQDKARQDKARQDKTRQEK